MLHDKPPNTQAPPSGWALSLILLVSAGLPSATPHSPTSLAVLAGAGAGIWVSGHTPLGCLLMLAPGGGVLSP